MRLAAGGWRQPLAAPAAAAAHRPQPARDPHNAELTICGAWKGVQPAQGAGEGQAQGGESAASRELNHTERLKARAFAAGMHIPVLSVIAFIVALPVWGLCVKCWSRDSASVVKLV